MSADDELMRIDAAGLRRRLRTFGSAPGTALQWQGRAIVNFSSNDYLGLASCGELKAAMIEGVQRYGVGSGASRLVCGNTAAHEQLDDALASFKSTEAALAFSSGYATAMGTIPALCGRNDIIILDKLSHASLIDAAKLSGATMRVFPHNNLSKLESLLTGVRAKPGEKARILVITESIFSMDGDAAPLSEIVELCEAHDALLLVDEAHAVGVLGPQGRGLVAQLGLEKRVALQMGTLSKALGVSGGYIAASRVIIDLLINKARSLIYTTAPPPALAFAATRAVSIVQSARGDELRAMLHRNKGILPMPIQGQNAPSAIIPLIIGDETEAMNASAALLERGYLIPAIRYPTVARGSARLRLTLSAAHEAAQIEGLVACLRDIVPQLDIAAQHPSEERTE